MLFTPIILGCLVANPVQCSAFMGIGETTEVACMNSLTVGLEFMAANRPDLYVAGLACVETHLAGQSVSGQ